MIGAADQKLNPNDWILTWRTCRHSFELCFPPRGQGGGYLRSSDGRFVAFPETRGGLKGNDHNSKDEINEVQSHLDDRRRMNGREPDRH